MRRMQNRRGAAATLLRETQKNPESSKMQSFETAKLLQALREEPVFDAHPQAGLPNSQNHQRMPPVEKHHQHGQKAHVAHEELQQLLSGARSLPGGFITDLQMEVSSTAGSEQGSGRGINKKPCFEKLRKQFRSG